MQNKTEKVLPKILRGSVHREFKKCGKSNCKCASGELHGAYYYHFVRINGKLKKRYLKANEVEKTVLRCNTRRELEKMQRSNLYAAWQKLREIRAEIREFRNHFK